MSKNQPSIGAALQFTQDALGGPARESDSVKSVSNAISQIANNNGDRVGLVICNLGVTDIYVAPNPAPGVNLGILLPASGGTLILSVRDDYTLPAREWYAAGAAAGPVNVYVLEYARYSLKGGIPS